MDSSVFSRLGWRLRLSKVGTEAHSQSLEVFLKKIFILLAAQD